MSAREVRDVRACVLSHSIGGGSPRGTPRAAWTRFAQAARRAAARVSRDRFFDAPKGAGREGR